MVDRARSSRCTPLTTSSPRPWGPLSLTPSSSSACRTSYAQTAGLRMWTWSGTPRCCAPLATRSSTSRARRSYPHLRTHSLRSFTPVTPPENWSLFPSVRTHSRPPYAPQHTSGRATSASRFVSCAHTYTLFPVSLTFSHSHSSLCVAQRYWGDLCPYIAPILAALQSLERRGVLRLWLDEHHTALHLVLLPYVNRVCESARNAWNHHYMGTADMKTSPERKCEGLL